LDEVEVVGLHDLLLKVIDLEAKRHGADAADDEVQGQQTSAMKRQPKEEIRCNPG
jgi:hypothetical protein